MRVPSIYGLKPRFQALLRPFVGALAKAGITANQVTVFACALSAGLGLFLTFGEHSYRHFIFLPILLFFRMALNAIDGMLAREFGQKSHLGAYLNELTDVVSDAFLYVPFAFLPGFDAFWIAVVIVLSGITEMTGTVAVMTGASRRYDGPMGKSDRAFWFGLVALAVGLGFELSGWTVYLYPRTMALLLVITIVNRVRAGLAEIGDLH
jgi:CDP-diacylglycerol--glycerol-3-phosphate 3-phosphatidyltransferase